MQDRSRRGVPSGYGGGSDKTAPRKRRVLVHKQVTAAEWEEHRERMEGLGLDPYDPVPVSFNTQEEEQFDGPPPFMEPPTMMRPASGSGGLGASSHEDGDNRKTFRGREPKKVSLQRRTLEEQIQSERHDRALERWSKQQKEWESFRQHAADKLGRNKEDLVVTKMEEHRERMEVMDLLDRATPEEVKSGGASWYMSLRGEGTRYVQIGNMFSGLFLPIKANKDKTDVETVRRPLLRELHDCRNRSREVGKIRRSWRDEEVLVHRLRSYGKKMKELAPGKLEVNDLLEPECIPLRPGMNMVSSRDQVQGDETGKPFDEDDVAAGDGHTDSNLAPIEEESSPPALIEGPNIEETPKSLQFHADVRKLCSKNIRLKNVGTACCTFEWRVNVPQRGFQESVLPEDPSNRFLCTKAKGCILPGREVNTIFTFTSRTPGTFTSSWRLHTYPELLNPITNVTMHGIALEGDLLFERRQSFRRTVHDQQILNQCNEIIEDILVSVKLDPEKPIDLSSESVQEKLFTVRNASEGLYWSPYAWQNFSDLDQRIDTLVASQSIARTKSMVAPSKTEDQAPRPVRGRMPVKKPKPGPPPPPPEMLAPHPKGMLDRLMKVSSVPRGSIADASSLDLTVFHEKQDLTVEVKRAMREAHKRPLERSPVWWAAHELVMEMVCSVPRFADHSRKFAGLDPLPFIVPPEADASEEVVADFQEKIAMRRALREKEETKDKETKATESFVKMFTKHRFGPGLERFSEIANEASIVASIRESALRLPSIPQRVHPYIGRQNVENTEMGGNVVVYEADLGFLDALRTAEGANLEELRISFPMVTLEQVKTKLQGLTSVLETNPLAVLVVAHVGSPPLDLMPKPSETTIESPPTVAATVDATRDGGDDNPTITESPVVEVDPLAQYKQQDAKHLQDIETRMSTLLTLEPLCDSVRELTESIASSVEFVPHAVWLGDLKGFASRVRNEAAENKVFILENLSAVPEELGILRISQVPAKSKAEEAPAEVEPPPEKSKKKKADKAAPPPVEEPPPPEEPPRPIVHRLTWSSREAWAYRVLNRIAPEVFVQDSLAASCEPYTFTSGIWSGAPVRVVGPSIETELTALVEALPALAPVEGEDAAAGGPPEEEADVTASGPAPLMCAVGGGGYERIGGEQAFLQKLRLLIAFAHLGKLEKAGIILALGGELAVCVLIQLLGISLGTANFRPSEAATAALRETFLQIIGVMGTLVMLPVDVVCEELKKGSLGADDSASAAPSPTGESDDAPKRPTFSLSAAFGAVASRPVFLGFVDGEEFYVTVDVERGLLMRGVPSEAADEGFVDTAVADGAVAADVGGVAVEGAVEGDLPPSRAVQLAAVPEGWQVRDIGDATMECLSTMLRRCRGMLWNGVFGVWDDERWQQGTRALLAFVEQRLAGGEEEEDEDEDEEEDEDVDEGAEAKPPKEKKEPDAEFEVAVVIGRDSAFRLPALVEAVSSINFVSETGDALLQILRGEPLPGLLACAQLGEGQ